MDLTDTFPEATIQTILKSDWPAVDSTWLAKERGRVRGMVRRCQGCDRCTGEHVGYSGPSRAAYVVVTEQPLIRAHRRLMGSLLSAGGLDPDAGMWVSTVSCEGTGAPTEREMEACRRNLLEQIELGQSQYVVLAGAVALKAFRGD